MATSVRFVEFARDQRSTDLPKKYIDHNFPAFDNWECGAQVAVCLVGSHLQNICIEVEGDIVETSVMLSPGSARKMIEVLQVALAEEHLKC
jgi:hypothetical protein